jgi:hypothetical protein
MNTSGPVTSTPLEGSGPRQDGADPRPRPADQPPRWYVCEAPDHHRTRWAGGPFQVIACPAPVGARTRCGAKARLLP